MAITVYSAKSVVNLKKQSQFAGRMLRLRYASLSMTNMWIPVCKGMTRIEDPVSAVRWVAGINAGPKS